MQNSPSPQEISRSVKKQGVIRLLATIFGPHSPWVQRTQGKAGICVILKQIPIHVCGCIKTIRDSNSARKIMGKNRNAIINWTMKNLRERSESTYLCAERRQNTAGRSVQVRVSFYESLPLLSIQECHSVNADNGCNQIEGTALHNTKETSHVKGHSTVQLMQGLGQQ